jgi:hypothetical protein
MELCTAVQEGCGYKDALRAHRYFAPLAKYFTVCITYQPAYVYCLLPISAYFICMYGGSLSGIGCAEFESSLAFLAELDKF